MSARLDQVISVKALGSRHKNGAERSKFSVWWWPGNQAPSRQCHLALNISALCITRENRALGRRRLCRWFARAAASRSRVLHQERIGGLW